MSLPTECPIEPAPRRRRKRPENKVQKEIVAWLLERGVLVAITDAGILNKLGLGMGCGIPAGWPDLTCCLPSGRFLGVECKATKGRHSKAQKSMQVRIEGNGGIYILAHSLAELIKSLHTEENFSDKKIGIPLD